MGAGNERAEEEMDGEKRMRQPTRTTKRARVWAIVCCLLMIKQHEFSMGSSAQYPQCLALWALIAQHTPTHPRLSLTHINYIKHHNTDTDSSGECESPLAPWLSSQVSFDIRHLPRIPRRGAIIRCMVQVGHERLGRAEVTRGAVKRCPSAAGRVRRAARACQGR